MLQNTPTYTNAFPPKRFFFFRKIQITYSQNKKEERKFTMISVLCGFLWHYVKFVYFIHSLRGDGPSKLHMPAERHTIAPSPPLLISLVEAVRRDNNACSCGSRAAAWSANHAPPFMRATAQRAVALVRSPNDVYKYINI